MVSGDPCQLRRCDAGRVAASSSVAGIRAGGGGQSHAHSAPRGDQTARTPPTSRRARPRVGAAQREVARRAAWPRSRPPTPLARRRPRGPRPPRGRPVSGWVRSRTGRQEEPAGARRAAGRRAPPVFNAGLFGVRVRRWLAVGHRTGRGETSARSGMGAVGSDGGFVRSVWRTPACCRRQGFATSLRQDLVTLLGLASSPLKF